VLHVRRDGSVDVYVHQITRVLNRSGIEHCGEVAIPPGAALLQLRTIKQDETVVQPEISKYKSTVSMPGLSPGDAIEAEYVLHTFNDANYGRFEFGSFLAPILYSRFVVISSTDTPITVSPSAPATRVRASTPERIEEWEQNDISQSVVEAAMPPMGLLPYVEVQPVALQDWRNVREYYRNVVVKALSSGARVEHRAHAFTSSDPEERARQIYRYVTSRIRSTYPAIGENLPSADDTLAFGEGNRTVALLALYQAAGMHADLVMARDLGAQPAEHPALDPYNRPLVRLRFYDSNGKLSERFVDAESDHLAFGVVPPSFDRTRVLVVPLEPSQGPAAFLSLPNDISSEQSIAEGDIHVSNPGQISATLRVRLGATRAAQLRTTLLRLTQSQRQPFFEQMANRIFPGATDVVGRVRNEREPDLPLEFTLSCRSNNIVVFHGSHAELGQLVPELGLRKMYASEKSRRFPLYLDTTFIESARFKIHLPAGFHVDHLIPSWAAENRFGEYRVRVREVTGNVLEIERAFNIPGQVVTPDRYPEFAHFALQIDNAESERIGIERNHPN